MHNEAGRVDAEAPGYFMDFSRAIASDRKTMIQTFNLIESVKNGVLRSGKYAGSSKILTNRSLVVFSNFLPNLKFLSLDRWQFFHTKLGIVYISCDEVYAGKQYSCSVTRDSNKCDVRSNELPWAEGVTDEDLIKQYLEVYNVDINFRMFYDNAFAFMPLVSNDQKSKIRKMIQTRNHSALYAFVKENHCFDKGIVTPEFIKDYGIFTQSEESSDNENTSETE
jgi:hypothetical protein